MSLSKIGPAETPPKHHVKWPGGPAIQQKWAFPLKIIEYIMKNPSNVRVYEKLIQTCKYFYENNPYLVLCDTNLTGSMLYGSVGYEEPDNYDHYRPKHVKVDLSKIKFPLWLFGDFTTDQFPNFGHLLEGRIVRSEIRRPLLAFPGDLPLDYFKKLFLKAEDIKCIDGRLVHGDGSVVKLEELIRCVISDGDICWPCFKRFSEKHPHLQMYGIVNKYNEDGDRESGSGYRFISDAHQRYCIAYFNPNT